jgi:hypothetical protein
LVQQTDIADVAVDQQELNPEGLTQPLESKLNDAKMVLREERE